MTREKTGEIGKGNRVRPTSGGQANVGLLA